jgi:GNAT superfamily N-acetyltransferase
MKKRGTMNFYKPKRIIEYIKLFTLYEKSFPVSEKKPISMILKMQKCGATDIWYFEEDGKFLGLAITINSPDLILVDYFAVSEKLRGKGYGSTMLKSLIAHYSDKGVFLEIERPYEWASNYSDRLRRRDFYLNKVGLIPLETYACLFGVDMELLGTEGVNMDYETYRNFYLHNYGKFAYDHISEPKGKA